MTPQTLQPPKVGKTEKPERQSPNFRKYSEVRTRKYLLPEEVELMRSAIKKSLMSPRSPRFNHSFALLPSRIASGRGGIFAMGANRLEWWHNLREASQKRYTFGSTPFRFGDSRSPSVATRLSVTTCNTNRSNLQSRHLQTRIICNYNYASARIKGLVHFW
ncbi:hypothetical protein [Komarekiella delphini-convector]|uniref:hypothetical protein n=1 Tax=Komarekiella delphini-convector TaxID=3050158 RepID=UPI0021E59E01|nr:hypothetical protein [Komarekiella delphini-convector]